MDIIVRQSCSKKRQTDPILRDCLNLVGISDDAREASDSEEEKNYIAESLEEYMKAIWNHVYVLTATPRQLYFRLVVENVGCSSRERTMNANIGSDPGERPPVVQLNFRAVRIILRPLRGQSESLLRSKCIHHHRRAQDFFSHIPSHQKGRGDLYILHRSKPTFPHSPTASSYPEPLQLRMPEMRKGHCLPS